MLPVYPTRSKLLSMVAILGFPFRVNCNARITCTNSSGVKPDLGLDQNQQ